MKRQILYATALLIIVGLLMTNAYMILEYKVNLIDYFHLSADYSEQEKSILKNKNQLIYGGNISEPPLGIYNDENGQYTGMVVDYISALSIELGEPIVSRPMIWNDALVALEKGETDLCDMIPSEERSQVFAFSEPIYDLNGAIVVPRKEGSVSSISELTGRIVVLQKGDFALEYMKKNNIEAEFILVDNLSEAMILLRDGNADAVVGDEPVAYHYLKSMEMTTSFKILKDPLYKNHVSLGVLKTNQDLLVVLNKAVFNLRKKGILAQIQEKWSEPTPGFYQDSSAEKLRLTLISIVFVSSIVFYIIWIWSKSLKLLVNIRTREVEVIKNELQIVFDSMSSFLAVIDQEGHIININGAFLNEIGCDEDSILNHSFSAIDILNTFDAAHGGLIHQWMNNSATTVFHDKYEISHNDRILICLCTAISQPQDSGLQLLVMVSDETKNRMQEMRLMHANKMETIGLLAAGIAHELRNPLGIIRNSGFVLKALDPEDTAYRDMAVKAIETSVTRASTIIDNLLKHSRLTNDRKDRIQLKYFLDEIINLFTSQFKAQTIHCTLLCREDLTLESYGTSLWHGILNIIQNAVDAMPEAGELNIEAHQNESLTTIKIRDTGSGISHENLERIFNPFFTTKPIGKGTGLGLYVAYSEVTKAGGIIQVMSEPEKGTCFIIKIANGGEPIEKTHETADC